MIVEREIAGFVLPYIAALTAISFLNASFSWGQTHILTQFSLAATSLAVTFLILPNHREWSPSVIWMLIIIAAMGCGCISALTYTLSEIGISNKITAEFLTDIGLRMQSVIESIPFTDSSTNGLISALITGDRTGISKEVSTAFRSSGASHILALSGLHLGIIYSILISTSAILGNSLGAKRARSVLIITSCGIYTLATGAGASISRAFLFILLSEIAKNTGRHRSTGAILFVSAFLQLTISPGSVHDIGFQLSYAAMAGIAFIYPWLKNLWTDGEKGVLRWIWNSAAISIACQITTGPLAYFYFGTFPEYFLLTNLIALPLTGLIIPSAILTATLNAFGICPEFIIRATESLTFILRECMNIISGL